MDTTRCQALSVLALVATLTLCANAYHYPILMDNQMHHPLARSDDSQQISRPVDENEAQHLRQLHQVVDTMAQLLTEKEQQRDLAQQSNSGLSSNQNPHELMSESEIRLALEELEKVQQQEKQAAESRQRPVVADAPSSQQTQQQPESQAQAQEKKDSAYETLIDELGDELIDEQLNMASLEAERLLRQRDSAERQSDKQNQPAESQFDPKSTSTPPSLTQQNNTPAPLPLPAPQSLYIGQLDPLGSELGPALTNDFYSFHADSKAGERTSSQNSAQQPASQSSSTEQLMYQQEANPDIPRKFDLSPQSQNDLDSAAQTRNTRHESQASNNLNSFQRDHNTIRFDITQPSNLNVPTQQSNLQSNPDNLVRQFRQQTGSIVDNGQFLTSTLVPISGPEHFWRPGSNVDQQTDKNNLNQQYNTLRSSSSQQQPQNLPPLPSPRFQSLNPTNQFSQATPLLRQQPAQVHFAGQSFVPGQSQFQQPQLLGINGRDRTFSPTSSPMISVLSSGDTSIGNSVSWNPPATINQPPPPQKLFNQQFLTSTQSSKPTDFTQSYYSPPSRPPFGSSFQAIPAERAQPISINLKPQQAVNPSSNFFNATEVNNLPETTTNERVVAPAITTTTQRSVNVQQSSTIQREAANLEPQPSIRALNNQRYFPSSDLAEPTSTSSSVYTEPARASRTPYPTTTSVTITPTTTPATVAANTTKKDDMVIYYYYYYDDNKNATVVAKNVTSRPPTLDEAIEADGGVEDTPYIEDPAPVTNLRTSSFKPTTTTTTTTTSTSTTTLPSVTTNSRLPNAGSDNRLRNQFGSSTRAQVPSNELSPKLAHPERVPVDSTNSINSINGDLRHLPSPTNRVPSIHSGGFVSEGIPSFTPNPIHVPTTSTSRSSGQVIPASNDASSNSRTFSTESSTYQVGSLFLTTPKSRAPSEFAQNGHINQPANAPARLPNNIAATHSHVSSSTAHVNRGSLSNASRYGTTNNLLMDPYGLDPSAPATVLQSGHSFTNDVSSVNLQHKNWQPAQSIRKSPSIPSTSNNLASIPVEQTQPKNHLSNNNRASSNSQHFSSQRNNNVLPNQNSLPARSPQQIASTQSASRGAASSPALVSSTSSRQVFPEINTIGQTGVIERVITESQPRVPQHNQKQFNTDKQSISNQKQQAGRHLGSQALPEGTLLKHSSPIIDETRETLPRLSFNNRPSTPEENTGNGFTRSPMQTSSPVTTFSTSSTTQRTQNNERVSSSSSSPVSSTQSTTSTTSSKSISPQTSVSTSVTQTITPSSPAVITVTHSTSSTSTSSSTTSSSPSTIATSSSTLTSSSLPSETTTPIQPASSSTNTPTPTQETQSSTESSDTPGATTRRRFGNRNSRFQTRLSSLNASSSRSTSTTTTTSAPSSTSTTRRPSVSTTRKSSRQLFAGRRRLSSFSQPETSSPATNSTSVLSDSASTTQPIETPAPTSSPSSTTGRARFGNSFTSRSRSTTSAPIVGPEQSSPTLRPTSLFGAQRTNKARLPFLKPNKPTTTTSETTTISSESASETNRENPEMMSTNFSSEKLATVKSTDPQDDTPENSLSSSLDDESLEKKDATSSQPVGEATTTEVPTSSSTTTESTNGRNKLKVRPLFASRQRSTSLFGNRRTNSTSTGT